MSEKGDPTAVLRASSQRPEAAEELNEKPEKDEKDRRQLAHEKEDEYGDQCHHPRSRKESEIAAEHTRDRPRRADHRDGTCRIDDNLPNSASKAAQEIEPGESFNSQRVFDIVSKYIEKPHIADQVNPTAVQKHTGKGRTETRKTEIDGQRLRYNAKAKDQTFKFNGRQRRLV